MKFLSTRIYQDFEGEYRLRNGDRRVHSVLACLDYKQTPAQILKKYPELSDRDIDACRVWAMMVMEERHEYRKNKGPHTTRNGKKHPSVKFMFDENLSWRLIPKVANKVSEVSQIHLEDMAGSKDIEIWNSFKTNGSRSVIITKDDDFIKLSKVFAMHAMMSERRFDNLDHHLKQYPFVVRINTGKRKNRCDKPVLGTADVSKAFNTNMFMFVKEAMRDQQRAVYMELSKYGVFKGPPLREIFKEFLTEKKSTLEALGLYQMNVEEIDLKTVDFARAINWVKLNEVRVSCGLETISAEDYAPPMRAAI